MLIALNRVYEAEKHTDEPELVVHEGMGRFSVTLRSSTFNVSYHDGRASVALTRHHLTADELRAMGTSLIAAADGHAARERQHDVEMQEMNRQR